MSVGSKEARRILAYPKSVPACIPAATDETPAGRRRAVRRCSSPRAARKATAFAPLKRAEEWSPFKHQPQPQLGPPRKRTQRSLSYWTEKGEIQGKTETKAEQRSVSIQYRNGPRSLASKLWSTARLSSGKSSSYPALEPDSESTAWAAGGDDADNALASQRGCSPTRHLCRLGVVVSKIWLYERNLSDLSCAELAHEAKRNRLSEVVSGKMDGEVGKGNASHGREGPSTGMPKCSERRQAARVWPPAAMAAASCRMG